MPAWIDHAGIFDEDIRRQNHDQDHHQTQKRVKVGQDRSQCKHQRYEIEDQYRSAMTKLQLEHQNMMEMTPVCLHDLLPLQLSADNCDQRIGDRNEQDQNRKTECNNRGGLEAKQR